MNGSTYDMKLENVRWLWVTNENVESQTTNKISQPVFAGAV